MERNNDPSVFIAGPVPEKNIVPRFERTENHKEGDRRLFRSK